jgi:hypothetical protein
MLYSKEDYQKTVALLRRIWLIILAISVVCIVVWVVLASQRVKEVRISWPGYVAAGVCSTAVVFIYGMFGSRVNAYRRFLRDVDQGLEREIVGAVSQIDETPTVSNNLEFVSRPYRRSGPVGQEPASVRLLRYDSVKGPVPFRTGRTCGCCFSRNNIKGYEILS